MMEENKVKAEPAVLTAVVQIVRKDTGKVEEYTITGTVPAEVEKKEDE